MIFEAKKELERIGGVEYLEQGDIGRTMRRECVVTKGGNRAKARPRPSHYRSRHCRRHCHHHHPHNQLDRGHCILINIQNPKAAATDSTVVPQSQLLILERKHIFFEDRATHRGHLHEWKAKRLLVKNCAKSGLCGGRAELLERLCYADFNLFQRVSLLLFEVMLC